MISPRSSPEGGLLVALLRENGAEVRRRIPETRDWTTFGALVTRHRLEPYLHRLCERNGMSPLLPATVRDAFAERHRMTLYGNIALLTSVRPILLALNHAGVTPIVLKGSALLERIYPDIGSRALTDVDILVPKNRFEEATRTVREHGFRYDPGTLRAGRRESYEAPDHVVAAVDVHWELSQKYRFQADMGAVWSNSLPLDLEGAAVRRLAPADEFVYLALHYAAHYFGVTLKWLVDLRELLRLERLDPREVVETAIRWRGAAGLHFALRYLDAVYGDALSLQPFAARLRRPVRDLLIRPFLSDDPLLLVKPLDRGPRRLAMGLLFVDRVRDMIRLGFVTHAPD